MGVQARIVLYAPDSSAARNAAAAAFDRIAYLDGVMSDYRSDSELMKLTARTGSGPIPVSDDLFHVLSFALDLARRSDGAFDVTIGPLVRLWREARRTGRLPQPGALAEAKEKVGWRLVSLDSLDRTVELKVSGMQLDLGGIAKGYAADEAVAAMRKRGVDRVMIEFGGDIVVGDRPPDADGWHITAALGEPNQKELTLSNAGVSSSGDTEQYVVIDGTRYSHVIDPRTGLGLTDRAAAIVVAPKGILSDGLATALSTMGPERGLAFVEREFPSVRAVVRHLD